MRAAGASRFPLLPSPARVYPCLALCACMESLSLTHLRSLVLLIKYTSARPSACSDNRLSECSIQAWHSQNLTLDFTRLLLTYGSWDRHEIRVRETRVRFVSKHSSARAIHPSSSTRACRALVACKWETTL